MQINKQILALIRKYTENRDMTMTEIARYLRVHPSYLTKSFKLGEMSEDKYNKLLKCVEKKKKEIEERKQKENQLLKTA